MASFFAYYVCAQIFVIVDLSVTAYFFHTIWYPGEIHSTIVENVSKIALQLVHANEHHGSYRVMLFWNDVAVLVSVSEGEIKKNTLPS